MSEVPADKPFQKTPLKRRDLLVGIGFSAVNAGAHLIWNPIVDYWQYVAAAGFIHHEVLLRRCDRRCIHRGTPTTLPSLHVRQPDVYRPNVHRVFCGVAIGVSLGTVVPGPESDDWAGAGGVSRPTRWGFPRCRHSERSEESGSHSG